MNPKWRMVLAVGLVSLALVACGGDDSDDDNDSGSASNSLSAEAMNGALSAATLGLGSTGASSASLSALRHAGPADLAAAARGFVQRHGGGDRMAADDLSPLCTTGSAHLAATSTTFTLTFTDCTFSVEDGTVVFDVTLAMTSNAELTVFSITMDGDLSFTSGSDASENIALSMSDLAVDVTDTGTAYTMDFSGTVEIEADCVAGSFTFTTIDPISILYSDDCPTDGVIEVSGSVVVTLTFNPDGSIDIDEGSDGTIDETLPDCDAAEVCV